MKDRIKQIMEDKNMTQQEFATYLNLSPASLSSIFNGRTNPTLNIVDAIKKKFPNISTDWLLYGSGTMYATPPSADVASEKQAPSSAEQMIDFGDTPKPSPALSSPSLGFQGGYASARNDMKNIYKVQRNITEIRIFYDDQTWETFVPKK